MKHPALSMYEFPPSTKSEVVTVEVGLEDGDTAEFGLNLEFDFDQDGNLVVVEINLLTAVDARMSDLRYDILSGLKDQGYKVWENALNI